MTFGEYLKGSREHLKVSQDAVAVAADVSRATIANYESGVQQPSLLIAIKIAKMLGMNLNLCEAKATEPARLKGLRRAKKMARLEAELAQLRKETE